MLCVLLVGLALATWGFGVEPGRLVVDEHDVHPARWPAALDGLRVAAMADIHAGAPHVGEAALRRLVDRVNAARPDLIVLLGDFVIHGVPGGRFMEPERIAEQLSGLRAPLGVLVVLGNHDHWYDGERVHDAFVDRGVSVLLNSSVELRHRETPFFVAGLDDIWAGHPDLAKTLQGIPADAPTLLLTHNPDAFPQVPPRVSLTLAGHTHGGQVRLPLIGAPVVPSAHGQRFAAGLVVEDGRPLFVTTGVGTSILPVRLGVAPEVAVLVLRSR